jgi:F5/8 type C domain
MAAPIRVGWLTIVAAVISLWDAAACQGPESFSASFAGGAGGAVGELGTGGADSGSGGAGPESTGGSDGNSGVNHCDPAQWTATASTSPANRVPPNAIDGDLTTRWGTGRSQNNTDWFQVDFGGVVKLSGITLNNTKVVPGDYPGNYAVHVSMDGAQFGEPIASGAGAPNMTVIHFAPQTARAVRINQIGTNRPMNWWQIPEFQPDCEM